MILAQSLLGLESHQAGRRKKSSWRTADHRRLTIVSGKGCIFGDASFTHYGTLGYDYYRNFVSPQ